MHERNLKGDQTAGVFSRMPLKAVNRILNLLLKLSAVSLSFAIPISAAQKDSFPKPPKPEPVELTKLLLPPASPSADVGACKAAITPHRTGCVDTHALSFQAGSFLPDGRHVLALVHFVGAPAAPDTASVYEGGQIILVKADGTRFSNGDAWKCVTCGVPAQNAVGLDPDQSYPQSFADGKRILEGSNIVDCSPYQLSDDRCTPKQVHIYPIRWNIHPDGSGKGGSIRELRLHPDNEHIGFNAMSFDSGQIGQSGYIARLEFNAAPQSGEPRTPRYDLTKVIGLYKEGIDSGVLVQDPQHPDQLRLNYNGITVGEFRGFSKDGREAFYIGYPWESCNIDVFAVDLQTGKVRRLTSNPEYVDPLDASPDDQWIVAEDTRGSDRQMFMAGMRGVPPIIDMVVTGAVSSVRNNGDRRFFQPFLIDRYGDRGTYQGQQLNAGDGKPGSFSDPNWNAVADPRWSYDGTRVAYGQAQVTSPACGGKNPLPCPEPTEPGGLRYRLIIARFTNRKPAAFKTPTPFGDSVPWGTPYEAGHATPHFFHIPEGTYVLRGQASGTAKVAINDSPDHRTVKSVAVVYDNYSDDGESVINGTESVSGGYIKLTTAVLDWRSNLTQTGKVNGKKVTSPDGFKLTIDVMRNIFDAIGTLTTTINGRTYTQPANGN
jgi:hypothetical protein